MNICNSQFSRNIKKDPEGIPWAYWLYSSIFFKQNQLNICCNFPTIELIISIISSFSESLFSCSRTSKASFSVTFEFFSGYKYFLLPQKVQKKTIYGFTVSNLFIANIQFISFCFHNLVTHGKYHPHIQHHFLSCTT